MKTCIYHSFLYLHTGDNIWLVNYWKHIIIYTLLGNQLKTFHCCILMQGEESFAANLGGTLALSGECK